MEKTQPKDKTASGPFVVDMVQRQTGSSTDGETWELGNPEALSAPEGKPPPSRFSAGGRGVCRQLSPALLGLMFGLSTQQ